MLHLGRLHLLHELSVLGTISAVAQAAHLTRPAVSQQLTQLGNDLDTVLIERQGRGVQLTPAGRRLVERAASLFQMVEDIEAELAAANVEVSGEIRMAAFGSLACSVVPQAINYLLEQHPQLRINFKELEPTDGLRAVTSKQVDIAIVDDLANSGFSSNILDYYPLCVDNLVLIVSAKHKFSNRSSVRLLELANENWALEYSADTYHKYLLDSCYAEGFSPREVASNRDSSTTLEMVRTGWVVTIMPRLGVRYAVRDPAYCIIPIEPPLIRRISIAIFKGTAKRPVIAAVLDALRLIVIDNQTN